jgi:hypothetical protein
MDRALFSPRMVEFDKGDHHLNAPLLLLVMSSNMAQAFRLYVLHIVSVTSHKCCTGFRGELAQVSLPRQISQCVVHKPGALPRVKILISWSNEVGLTHNNPHHHFVPKTYGRNIDQTIKQ